MKHFIVPPHLLRRIAALDEESAGPAPSAARRALREIGELHRFRVAAAKEPTVRPRSAVAARTPGVLAPSRQISDAQNTESLPGVLVRSEGQDPTGDAAVDEAYEHLGATYRYFAEVHGRDSMDGLGMPLPATVHYGVRYENAFWDGTRMVFGDGDGMIFTRFTASLSVVAHELVHGMTQFVTQLSYHGQAGAIHESVSDVFGSLVDQYSRSQTAGQAHWLIGAELFTPAVSGVAIRSMAAPGTAYDDERLGRDPQAAMMDGYVETEEDSGGVHLNSGIPNHAFYRAATALGGYAWEHAGRVWYDTVTLADLPSDCSFSLFAEATRTAAERRFGGGSAVTSAVEQAWDEVGVRLPGRSQVLS